MKYIATFPAGSYPIIVKHLKSFSLDELELLDHDDSSLTFSSPLPVERLIELRYITNVYMVIDQPDTIPRGTLKGDHFRLMMLQDGSPHHIDSKRRDELGAKIKRYFRLTPSAHLSKNDFWIIKRTSGVEFFTLRLSRAKFKREVLQPGELRPELAHILCMAAGIKAKHAVLDMFAGYGAIPFEAVRGFGCKQVIAVDQTELPRRHENKEILWRKASATRLDFIADASIDRIVTDPPWGVYGMNDELTTLYEQSTKEMLRVLKPGGVAVVLSGYDQAESVFEHTRGFVPIGRWNVLVSGKKASIFKLQKSAGNG